MKIFYKYNFITILLFVLSFTFISCQQDAFDDVVNNVENVDNIASIQDNITGLTKVEIPEGITSVNVYNWADDEFLGTATVENGHIWIGSTNASLTVKLYDASVKSQAKSQAKTRAVSGMKKAASLTDLGYIGDATVYKSEDNLLTIQAADNVNSGYSSSDFLNIFPSGSDNRNIDAPANSTNFSHDVLYVSDGNPFSVYPIYSNGWYDITLGIFYYDETGTRHDIDFWSMLTVNWKTPYSELANSNNGPGNNGPGNINNNNSKVYSVDKTSNAQGYQITLPEHYVYGFYVSSNNDANSGQYFSYSEENTCKEKHAVNIVDKSGINYLSFEDQDNGDWDVNDLICYINPKIEIIPEPTPEKLAEEIKKINSVIIVPDDVDKIVHENNGDCDVEARFDGKGHDYVRIAKPLYNDEEIEIDLDNMNQYCEKDDMRVVAHDDETVIYCPNNNSQECDYNNSHIKVNNGCTDSQYGKITTHVTGKDGKKDDDCAYQVKVDMYPKSEDCFNDVVKHMENKEWDKLFTCKKK